MHAIWVLKSFNNYQLRLSYTQSVITYKQLNPNQAGGYELPKNAYIGFILDGDRTTFSRALLLKIDEKWNFA